MTTLQIYENVLVELNKVEAPSLLLQDFNYFLNKAIYQRVNKDYNFYDVNQQISDSLNPLTKTVELHIGKGKNVAILNDLDYMHALSCTVEFTIKSNCNESILSKGAIRLIADSRAQIESNYYMKPSYKRPYYCVHDSSSQTKIEILHGNKPGVTIDKIKFQYLKEPEKMELTDEQINEESVSQEMEFSEYICYEIINDIVKLIMENASDPRLQSHIPINQTIASPFSGGSK